MKLKFRYLFVFFLSFFCFFISDVSATQISINETNFPDAGFRECLAVHSSDNTTVDSSITELSCESYPSSTPNYKIKSVKGIELFTNLDTLYLEGNLISSIDLSKNTKLYAVDLINNKLTSLDLSKNTSMKEYYFGVQSIDVTEYYDGNNYYINLSELDANLNSSKVSELTSGITISNGVLNYKTSMLDKKISYKYDVSSGNEKMPVELNIVKSIDISKKYVATFYKNGAQLTVPSNCVNDDKTDSVKCTCTSSSSCEITAPTISRDGYTVLGYGTEESHTYKTIDNSIEITLSGDVKYYAVTEKKLNVTFKMSDKIKSIKKDKNSQEQTSDLVLSCSIYNKSKYCIVLLPLITIDPSKNLTVAGWNTDKNATSGKTGGQSLNVDSDATYYPIVINSQESVKYTVAFVSDSLDEIVNKSLSCTTVTGKTCKITLPDFTKKNYNSLGWSSKKDSTKADYKIGDEIELSKNITLYPVYEQIKSSDNSDKDTGTTENVGTGISSLIYVLVPIALGTGVLLYTKKIKRN